MSLYRVALCALVALLLGLFSFIEASGRAWSLSGKDGQQFGSYLSGRRKTLILTTPFAIHTIIRLNSGSKDTMGEIVTYTETNNTFRTFSLYSQQSRVYFNFLNMPNVTVSTQILDTKQWHEIFVYVDKNESRITLYVDGTQSSTVTMTPFQQHLLHFSNTPTAEQQQQLRDEYASGTLPGPDELVIDDDTEANADDDLDSYYNDVDEIWREEQEDRKHAELMQQLDHWNGRLVVARHLNARIESLRFLNVTLGKWNSTTVSYSGVSSSSTLHIPKCAVLRGRQDWERVMLAEYLFRRSPLWMEQERVWVLDESDAIVPGAAFSPLVTSTTSTLTSSPTLTTTSVSASSSPSSSTTTTTTSSSSSSSSSTTSSSSSSKINIWPQLVSASSTFPVDKFDCCDCGGEETVSSTLRKRLQLESMTRGQGTVPRYSFALVNGTSQSASPTFYLALRKLYSVDADNSKIASSSVPLGKLSWNWNVSSNNSQDDLSITGSRMKNYSVPFEKLQFHHSQCGAALKFTISLTKFKWAPSASRVVISYLLTTNAEELPSFSSSNSSVNSTDNSTVDTDPDSVAYTSAVENSTMMLDKGFISSSQNFAQWKWGDSNVVLVPVTFSYNKNARVIFFSYPRYVNINGTRQSVPDGAALSHDPEFGVYVDPPVVGPAPSGPTTEPYVSHSHAGLIIGIIIGCLIVLAAVIVGFILYVRRARRRNYIEVDE